MLKDLHVRFNKKSIQARLHEHPEYPSLLAVNDCLTEMNVGNQTFMIEKDGFDTQKFNFPFIAHISHGQGKLVLVHGIEKGLVEISDENIAKRNIPEEDFLNDWSGVALFAEADEESMEKDFAKNRIKHLINDAVLPVNLLLASAVFFYTLVNRPFSWVYTSICLIKLLGLILTTMLLIQSISANNPFIKNLCNFGGKTSCNVILKSESAKVTSWLNWSEVGFLYFAGSLIILLVDPATKPFLLWLNLFALPYTIYSISYQYRSSNWCPLCCAVQLILWMEFFSNITDGFSTYSPQALSLGGTLYQLFIAITFILPAFLWFFLKPFFLDAAKLKSLHQELGKFKYNSELFNQALKNQPCYIVGEELLPIVIGNPNARTEITMVSNPFCGPCGKAHRMIDEWLKTRDDLQLKVVFTTADDDDDRRTKVARHVSALSNLEDKKIAENALHEWYLQSNKKYETWAEKYPISFDSRIKSVTEKQKIWCKMAEITYTPTILINGYKLPDPYRLEDLKYLI